MVPAAPLLMEKLQFNMPIHSRIPASSKDLKDQSAPELPLHNAAHLSCIFCNIRKSAVEAISS